MTQMPAVRAGLDRAIDIANRAMRNVPAYAAHLRVNGYLTASIDGPGGFAGLPPMTKTDYLRRYPTGELMWYGDMSAAGTWSSTSGSSGSPTFFPRDTIALGDCVSAYERIFRDGFSAHTRSTLVVVCFAMGTWIGGTYTYQGMVGLRERGYRLSVITPGIDVDAAVRILTELGPQYEQVVLAGYPASIKDVLDRSGQDALAQDIKILLAGEAITESWRDHVLGRIGRSDQPERVCLIYGTAEAGVMGHETPLTAPLRRRATVDPVLDAQLFGGNATRQPAFVEFDPQSRFTETDDEGFLLFTIDSSLPLIRYRINDKGNVLSGLDLRRIVDACGHEDLGEWIDPAAGFLVLAGRPDVAASFYGLNIYPGDLHEAFDADEVVDHVTGRFVMDPAEDGDLNQILVIAVELGESSDYSDTLDQALIAECVAALTRNNNEFRALRSHYGERTTPQIRFYTYGTGPFLPGGPKNDYARPVG